MGTDDVAAALAAIRERIALAAAADLNADALNEVYAALVQLACADSPLLLAAVELVLEQHQPGRVAIVGVLCKRHEAHRHFSIDAREAADVRSCPDCAAMIYRSCTGCATGVSVDACPVREAIRAALAGTGKEGSEDA